MKETLNAEIMPDLLTNEERLIWLCQRFKFDELTDNELARIKAYPYIKDVKLNSDFVMGAQNVVLMLTDLVMVAGFPIDLRILSLAYLYPWFLENKEKVLSTDFSNKNEFTETEL